MDGWRPVADFPTAPDRLNPSDRFPLSPRRSQIRERVTLHPPVTAHPKSAQLLYRQHGALEVATVLVQVHAPDGHLRAWGIRRHAIGDPWW